GRSESRFPYFSEGLTQLRGRRGDSNPCRGHGVDLGFGATLAASNNRASVAHAPAGRRGSPGDKADGRFLAAALGFVLEKLRRIFLGRAADLADHDNRLGRLVGE